MEVTRASDDAPVYIEMIMGTIEIVPVREVRPDGIWLGGYSIRRDMFGKEVSRTPVAWNCRVFAE